MRHRSTHRSSQTKYIQFLVPTGFSVPGDTHEISAEDELFYYYNDPEDRYCYTEKELEGVYQIIVPEVRMGKPPTSWKKVEQHVANYWGGKRRGADFKKRTGLGGKNDVVDVPGWSIEVKHSKRPTWSLMVEAVAQAEGAREQPNDIPVAVIHKLGDEYGNSLVIMRLETFAQFFINNRTT
jgi:hypothetical protein